jgi:hypothetical protein
MGGGGGMGFWASDRKMFLDDDIFAFYESYLSTNKTMEELGRRKTKSSVHIHGSQNFIFMKIYDRTLTG